MPLRWVGRQLVGNASFTASTLEKHTKSLQSMTHVPQSQPSKRCPFQDLHAGETEANLMACNPEDALPVERYVFSLIYFQKAPHVSLFHSANHGASLPTLLRIPEAPAIYYARVPKPPNKRLPSPDLKRRGLRPSTRERRHFHARDRDRFDGPLPQSRFVS